MSVIVTDKGFAPEDWTGPVRPLAEIDAIQQGDAVEIAPSDDVEALRPHLSRIGMVRVLFPAFNDGRGFTHARDLRDMGFTGRLRAGGRLIADQYAMARRSGFDEIEIDDATAERQPWPQWEARADWRAHDYQSRLRA